MGNRIWGVELVMGKAQERSLATQILTFGWRRKKRIYCSPEVELISVRHMFWPQIHIFAWWLKLRLLSKRDAFNHDERLKNLQQRLPCVCVSLVYKYTFLLLIPMNFIFFYRYQRKNGSFSVCALRCSVRDRDGVLQIAQRSFNWTLMIHWGMNR